MDSDEQPDYTRATTPEELSAKEDIYADTAAAMSFLGQPLTPEEFHYARQFSELKDIAVRGLQACTAEHPQVLADRELARELDARERAGPAPTPPP